MIDLALNYDFILNILVLSFFAVCDDCGKMYRSKSGFKMHQRSHRGEFKHKCDICDKGFFDTNSYKGHMSKHTGERKFSCNQCGQTYKSLCVACLATKLKHTEKNVFCAQHAERPVVQRHSCKDTRPATAPSLYVNNVTSPSRSGEIWIDTSMWNTRTLRKTATNVRRHSKTH